MRLSTRGRYGMRVMTELAARFGQGPVLVEKIAVSQGLSGNYIHNLMIALKAAGLVRATRGPAGGYELVRPPGQITALDVFLALEGPLTVVDCGANGGCPRTAACATRDLWREAGAAMEKVLADATLAELAERQRAKSPESLAFQI